MFIINNKKIFIGVSAFFVLLSLGALLYFGLPLGIEFKGGSQMQFSYSETRPEINLIKENINKINIGETSVQPTAEKSVVVKSRDLSQEERVHLNEALNRSAAGTEESFTNIGPSVGAELKRKAIISIILVLITIICFVAYAFRNVSKPVSSWKYGFAVIIALIHDIIIPTGVFSIIAHYSGAEVDTLFIVALLTTLALSIADTIVVFDRIRENIGTKNNKQFSQIVGESLSQTFVRSINTSAMVLIMVVSLAVFGPASTRLFAIILAIGMFFGTYSSIFLASPLLVLFEQLQKKR